ncbi:MAG: HIRAN domain-containing protein [Chloroflexi bacterium]|nr:HIRAN domain-containing protein [Chloroflexota bacterium]
MENRQSGTGIRGLFHTKVVGVTFNNDDGTSRQEILQKCSPGEGLILSHAPIPEDKNAVKVSRATGEQVGWLSRWNAQEIAPILKRGQEVVAEIAAITGGGDEQSLGCTIIIAKPEAIKELESRTGQRVDRTTIQKIPNSPEIKAQKKRGGQLVVFLNVIVWSIVIIALIRACSILASK